MRQDQNPRAMSGRSSRADITDPDRMADRRPDDMHRAEAIALIIVALAAAVGAISFALFDELVRGGWL